MATGTGSACSCQPEALSAVKTTEAIWVPVSVHRRAVWTPESAGAFQKRRATIEPSCEEVNCVPSSWPPVVVFVAGVCVVKIVTALGVGVTVGVAVIGGVGVGVGVDVASGIGVGVAVGVCVGVAVGVRVGVMVAVRVGVWLGVDVGVLVAVV